MRWITRENIKVDRVACPWLIKRFVDHDAEFLFVPESELLAAATREHATPFDATAFTAGISCPRAKRSQNRSSICATFIPSRALCWTG